MNRYWYGMAALLISLGGAAVLLGCITNAEYEVVLSVIGLGFDGLGAIIVLSGELRSIKRRVVPESRIEQIESARHQLYDNEVIQRGDAGYDEILNIIDEEHFISGRTKERLQEIRPADNSESSKIHRYLDCISYGSLSKGVLPTSSKAKIYGFTKINAPFRDNELDFTDESGKDALRDNNQFFGPWSIMSPMLFDSKLNQKTLEMEQRGIQTPLRIGVMFLLLGFFLQILSKAPSLGITFGIC